jgi:hypothetical protein
VAVYYFQNVKCLPRPSKQILSLAFKAQAHSGEILPIGTSGD